MTKPNNGGPAFPLPQDHNRRGMSLRDWFAGQALSVLASEIDQSSGEPVRGVRVQRAVQLAYEIADEALRVRAAPSLDEEELDF